MFVRKELIHYLIDVFVRKELIFVRLCVSNLASCMNIIDNMKAESFTYLCFLLSFRESAFFDLAYILSSRIH